MQDIISNRKLLDAYSYEGKSKLLQFADFCNEGVYKLNNGKRYSIEGYNIREVGFKKRRAINVICALVIPLLAATLLIKCLSHQNQLRQRKVEGLKKTYALNQKKIAELKLEQKNTASTTIKAAFKVHKHNIRNAAATKIQRLFKTHTTRKQYLKDLAADKAKKELEQKVEDR